MPRFQGENFAANLRLLDRLEPIARAHGCTMAQIALAWVLAQREYIVPIPGTTRPDHLEENVEATNVRLDRATLDQLEAVVNPRTVAGPRYNSSTLPEIDTEEL